MTYTFEFKRNMIMHLNSMSHCGFTVKRWVMQDKPEKLTVLQVSNSFLEISASPVHCLYRI